MSESQPVWTVGEKVTYWPMQTASGQGSKPTEAVVVGVQPAPFSSAFALGRYCVTVQFGNDFHGKPLLTTVYDGQLAHGWHSETNVSSG